MEDVQRKFKIQINDDALPLKKKVVAMCQAEEAFHDYKRRKFF